MKVEEICNKIEERFIRYQLDAVLDLISSKKRSRKSKLKEIVRGIVDDWKEYTKRLGGGQVEEFASKWADRKVTNRTTEIFRWYSQDSYRVSYANESAREFGVTDIVLTLRRGMILLLEEFIHYVLVYLYMGGRHEDSSD